MVEPAETDVSDADATGRDPGDADRDELVGDGGGDGDGAVDVAPAGRRPPNWWAITAVVVIVAVVAATLAGGLLTRRNAVAATVDGHDISQASLLHDLGAFRDNKSLAGQQFDQQGDLYYDAQRHVTTAWAATWLGNDIIDLIVHREFVRRGLSVKASDVTARFRGLAQANPGFPKWFLERVARDRAEQVALNTALRGDASGSAVNAFIGTRLRRAKVTVDPRFGRFDLRSTTGSPVVAPSQPVVRDERHGSNPTPASPTIGG